MRRRIYDLGAVILLLAAITPAWALTPTPMATRSTSPRGLIDRDEAAP
jgi:hypothetical protein